MIYACKKIGKKIGKTFKPYKIYGKRRHSILQFQDRRGPKLGPKQGEKLCMEIKGILECWYFLMKMTLNKILKI